MKPTQEQVIAWAREAGFKVHDEDKFMNTHISDTLVHIHTAAENLATLAYEAGRKDEREKVAQWMIQRSYATGHGDTTEDLLAELEWQVREELAKAQGEKRARREQ